MSRGKGQSDELMMKGTSCRGRAFTRIWRVEHENRTQGDVSKLEFLAAALPEIIAVRSSGEVVALERDTYLRHLQCESDVVHYQTFHVWMPSFAASPSSAGSGLVS